MDYKKLNAFLSNLNLVRDKVATEVTPPDEYTGENFEVYPAESVEEGLYVRLKIWRDSYGGCSQVVGVEFVRPTEVKVTNFVEA